MYLNSFVIYLKLIDNFVLTYKYIDGLFEM